MIQSKPDKEWQYRYVINLIRNKGMRACDVVDKYNIERTLLYKLMREAGVSSNSGTVSKTFTRRLIQDLMERQYIREDLEGIFKCKHTAIEKNLKRLKVKYPNAKQFDLSNEETEKLKNLHENGYNLSKLSEEFGVSRPCIQCFMKRKDIPIKKFHPYPWLGGIDKKWFVYTHIDEQTPVKEIATMLKVPDNVIRSRMQYFGIKVINYRLKNNHPKLKDKEWLIDKHHKQRLSCGEIGEILRCSPSVINRALSKFGIKSYAPTDIIDDRLDSVKWMSEKHIDEKLTTDQISELIGCSSSLIRRKLNNLGIGCMGYRDASSKEEEEIANMVEDMGYDVTRSDRIIIKPKEIDILVPSEKIGIEYNGIYWHCDENKEKEDHQVKWLLAKNSGIDLIQIWDYQMTNDPRTSDYIKSVLSNKKFLMKYDVEENTITIPQDHNVVMKADVIDGVIEVQKFYSDVLSIFATLEEICKEYNFLVKVNPETAPIMKILKATNFVEHHMCDVEKEEISFCGRDYTIYRCSDLILKVNNNKR